MSKYQEAIDKGYTEEQIMQYFKPKIDQALGAVGEEKTKAYLLDQVGLPSDKLNLYMGKPNEANNVETVPTEQTYLTVPARIKKYKAAGLDDAEAIDRAKADYYHSKGFPAPKAGEQIEEHIWGPMKEGLATVGTGYLSLVDDLLSSVGLNNENMSKNLEEARRGLAEREKQYEDKYGADVVREVSKKIPAILAAVSNPTSLTSLAATEVPLAYAETRGEGGTVEEAATSAAITGAIPAAIGLGKVVNSVIKFPARQKSKLLETVNQQAKKDMLEVLQYAETKGIVLTPTQLTDNGMIEQLTDVVARNPVIKQRFDSLNNQNKALLLDAYANLKQSLSPQDVTSAFIKGDVDPFGTEIQKTLKGALKLRKERTNEAYALFDELASDIKVPEQAKGELIAQLDEIKSWGQKTNNPEGVASLINDAVRRVKGVDTITPTEDLAPLTQLFKGYEKPTQEAMDLTLADLNNVSKQLYKQGRNIQDPTLKAVWERTRSTINDYITKLSDPETADVLNLAKQQHIAKEKLYGVKPDFKAIAKAVDTSHTDEIVNSLLKGKAARSNAAQLKREFALAGRPEMSKALAKRYLEDSLSVGVKEFRDIGKLEVQDIIKSYSKVDPEILKLLAGESAAKEIRLLTKLAKSTKRLEDVTNYKIMTGIPSPATYITDLVKGAVQSKLVGDLLSSDKAMKGLLKLWTGNTAGESGLKVAKDVAKAAGLSEKIFRPKPASEVIGPEARTVYRASEIEKGISRGPLGKGTYYFLDEAKATDRMSGTNKKMFSITVDPEDLATMETVSAIIGRPAKFSDIRPSVIKDLKLRGFKGMTDEGELVIFENIKE